MGRVGLTERGLAHQGSVGLVVIIVRVSEGLVDMDIVGDAGNQLGVSSGGSGLEVEVLNGQTFGGFSLVAEGLLDVLVVRVDALNDEMALAVGTTDDPGDISVLKLKENTIRYTPHYLLYYLCTEKSFSQPAPLVMSQS